LGGKLYWDAVTREGGELLMKHRRERVEKQKPESRCLRAGSESGGKEGWESSIHVGEGTEVSKR